MNKKEEQRLVELLAIQKKKGKDLRWCVVGAGNGGLSVAGFLGINGYQVALFNRTDDHLNGVRWHGGIRVTGAVEGFGPVAKAVSVMSDALDGVDIVMVVTPATAHESLAVSMAPCLKDGQIIILNPGRTGGALEFRRTLQSEGCKALVLIAEAQTFIHASRAISRHEVHIHRIKNSVPVATLPAYWIPDMLAIIRPAFPTFVAGNNVLSTSLENIGAVFHPALTLLNAAWIETTGGDFEYYLDGVSPSVAKILELIDQERVAVASALGVHSVSAREWLYLSYDSPGKNLYEAIRQTDSYRGIKAPRGIMHRYVFEDVPMSLVPIASLGESLKVPTPSINLIIDMANAMHGTDYRANGRTVDKLGLSGLTVKEIRQLVVGVTVVAKEERHG